MKVAIDTNILVRLFVIDDEKQHRQSLEILDQAENIIIPTTVFCETIWVLRRLYQQSNHDIYYKLSYFLTHPKLIYAQAEVEAGFAFMQEGGDFADGVNEYAGSQLGAESFATFDQKAIKLFKKLGKNMYSHS